MSVGRLSNQPRPRGQGQGLASRASVSDTGSMNETMTLAAQGIPHYNVGVTEQKQQLASAKSGSLWVGSVPTDGKPPHYVLEMLLYPNAEIRMRQVLNYTLDDVALRYKHAPGFSALHPMGWKAFGLLAEDATGERGIHSPIGPEFDFPNLPAGNGHAPSRRISLVATLERSSNPRVELWVWPGIFECPGIGSRVRNPGQQEKSSVEVENVSYKNAQSRDKKTSPICG